MSLQKVDDFKYQFVVMPNDWESISNDEFMDIVQVATESFATGLSPQLQLQVILIVLIRRAPNLRSWCAHVFDGLINLSHS